MKWKKIASIHTKAVGGMQAKIVTKIKNELAHASSFLIFFIDSRVGKKYKPNIFQILPEPDGYLIVKIVIQRVD